MAKGVAKPTVELLSKRLQAVVSMAEQLEGNSIEPRFYRMIQSVVNRINDKVKRRIK